MRHAVLVFLVFAAACGPSVRVTQLSPAQYPPKPADTPIRMYAADRPTCPFEELATVRSRQRSKLVSMNAVTEAVRQRARELGGDAVIGVSEGSEVHGGMVVGSMVSVSSDPVVSAVIIRFKDPSCRE